MKLLASLNNRIFLASAALTMLCVSSAIYVVNGRVTAWAEDELQRALLQSGAMLDEQRAAVFNEFAVLTRMIADLPKLKAAVDTDDPPTVRRIATGYQRDARADLFLVTNRWGRVLASVASRGDGRAPADLPGVHAALQGRETSMFCLQSGAVLQVVSVPITAGAEPPDIVGTLTLGFLLDDEMAARFKRLTGSDIAFAAGGRIVATTLPAATRPALAAASRSSGVSRMPVAGDDYVVLIKPLASSLAVRDARPNGTADTNVNGASAAGEMSVADNQPAPLALILRSRSERLRLLRPIQTAIIATGALAMLLAIGLSYGIARTITRPIAVITDTMRDMAATGDLTTKIAGPTSRWEDEDARLLARTFNSLTDSVTRFQREAADRERLSALGRLSAVVAHEVRNPLMIIKASLRPLARGQATAEEMREATADINEEVTRLNSLVNDVLDFARPLRFELAVTDVNQVCQAAATAAAADTPAVSTGVALEELPPVATDAERLRTALVNILVNARHAVSERRLRDSAAMGAPAATTPPDVGLSTRALAGGRIAITVRDRGVGIDASDLPRVFEPYFTTKRAGTGLGLAISRNIIEGLGGVITATSQPGAGTEIRIELPAAAPGWQPPASREEQGS